MYIVHPALEGGRLKDLILSIEKSMNKLEGKTCAINVWGKKKLAYSINKEKYGVYILFQFQNEGSNNKAFNLELEHNPNVLAYLTTKINEDEILQDISDLDVQLGLSKPSSLEQKEDNQTKDSKTTDDNNSSEQAIEEEPAEKESDSQDVSETNSEESNDSEESNKEEE
tara:strand:- start:592 stop:1098 length:507 start_codon:yes stop_codon:yes gene_type:complete